MFNNDYKEKQKKLNQILASKVIKYDLGSIKAYDCNNFEYVGSIKNAGK